MTDREEGEKWDKKKHEEGEDNKRKLGQKGERSVEKIRIERRQGEKSNRTNTRR